ATGLPLGVAGVLLSNLLFLAALLVFDSLTAELFDPELARRATALLAVFPTTYVCSMIYPESLVLLASAATGFLALRGRWGSCCSQSRGGRGRLRHGSRSAPRPSSSPSAAAPSNRTPALRCRCCRCTGRLRGSVAADGSSRLSPRSRRFSSRRRPSRCRLYSP